MQGTPRLWLRHQVGLLVLGALAIDIDSPSVPRWPESCLWLAPVLSVPPVFSRFCALDLISQRWNRGSSQFLLARLFSFSSLPLVRTTLPAVAVAPRTVNHGGSWKVAPRLIVLSLLCRSAILTFVSLPTQIPAEIAVEIPPHRGDAASQPELPEAVLSDADRARATTVA